MGTQSEPRGAPLMGTMPVALGVVCRDVVETWIQNLEQSVLELYKNGRMRPVSFLLAKRLQLIAPSLRCHR